MVTAGLGIYDTMQYVKPDISTLCMGQAASMGSFLLAAGTKGKRFSLPNSRIMVHQPSAGFQGQATDIEIHEFQYQLPDPENLRMVDEPLFSNLVMKIFFLLYQLQAKKNP